MLACVIKSIPEYIVPVDPLPLVAASNCVVPIHITLLTAGNTQPFSREDSNAQPVLHCYRELLGPEVEPKSFDWSGVEQVTSPLHANRVDSSLVSLFPKYLMQLHLSVEVNIVTDDLLWGGYY